MGVESIPHCGGHSYCYPINSLAKSMIYTSVVQSGVGPAGYFRDPNNLESYLKQSHFLPDLNNERNFSEERKSRVKNRVIG